MTKYIHIPHLTRCKTPITFFSSDHYVVDSYGNQKLVIRDHKTSDSTGTVVVPLTGILAELMAFWVTRTERVVRDCGHCSVFFSRYTKQPFLEKSYTTYVKRNFADIYGRSLTQQMLRRIFAKGLCHPLDPSSSSWYS